MDTGGLFVAGSHNRNEFTVINIDESGRVRTSQDLFYACFSHLLIDSGNTHLCIWSIFFYFLFFLDSWVDRVYVGFVFFILFG